ncbi:hypothetical protein QZH41_005659 [Actinostola sp. cb2023]|nr:hypothetical protein QZH41_005659 [Actinostola sp. cb2023]
MHISDLHYMFSPWRFEPQGPDLGAEEEDEERMADDVPMEDNRMGNTDWQSPTLMAKPSSDNSSVLKKTSQTINPKHIEDFEIKCFKAIELFTMFTRSSKERLFDIWKYWAFVYAWKKQVVQAARAKRIWDRICAQHIILGPSVSQSNQASDEVTRVSDVDGVRRANPKAKDTVFTSKEDGTVRTNLGGFNRWATVNGVGYLPASPFHVAVYLQLVSQEASSPSPVLTAVYSIDWVHKLSGYEKVSVHPLEESMMGAFQRILARPKCRKEPMWRMS